MSTGTRRIVLFGALCVMVALLAANEWRMMHEEGYDWYERVQQWVAAVCTVAIYSFLYRENVFYRTFEHVMLGCAAGMSCAVILRQQLVEQWFVPMVTAYKAWWERGLDAEVASGVLLIVPGIVGLLWYFQYSKRYFWVSRITFCITVGAGVGLGFKDTFNQLMPQITETFKPLWVGEGITRVLTLLERVGASLENVVFVVGTVCVLVYFFFVVERRAAVVRVPAQIGRWYLMIALGAFFGNTFMTRLSALIERIHFLCAEWLRLTGR
ncbi:MAG: hypothetical protein N2595_06660 [bacterium]|nr:hypothetical protein [bacterium]